MRLDGTDYYPNDDKRGFAAAKAAVPDIADKWLPMVGARRSVFQAGGNCGLFPRELSRHFDAVYTMEPDAENWECLSRNCQEPNVFAFRAAVGAKAGFCSVIHPQPDNSGAHYIDLGGITPVIAIDSLVLPDCDLIALDVEGYEWFAIQGARETIARCRPTVIFEVKHSARFGKTRDDIARLLPGYRQKAKVGIDEIWIP